MAEVNLHQTPRDYEAEIMQLQKQLCCLSDENNYLAHKIEELKECIVRMTVARYMANE